MDTAEVDRWLRSYVEDVVGFFGEEVLTWVRGEQIAELRRKYLKILAIHQSDAPVPGFLKRDYLLHCLEYELVGPMPDSGNYFDSDLTYWEEPMQLHANKYVSAYALSFALSALMQNEQVSVSGLSELVRDELKSLPQVRKFVIELGFPYRKTGVRLDSLPLWVAEKAMERHDPSVASAVRQANRERGRRRGRQLQEVRDTAVAAWLRWRRPVFGEAFHNWAIHAEAKRWNADHPDATAPMTERKLRDWYRDQRRSESD